MQSISTQELFSKLLLSQRANRLNGKLAWDDKENMGLYSDIKNDCKCPVGEAINPKLYTPIIEGRTVKDKFVATVLKLHGYTPEQIALLDKLQIVHDTIDPYDWEREWKRIAIEFNLTTPDNTEEYKEFLKNATKRQQTKQQQTN